MSHSDFIQNPHYYAMKGGSRKKEKTKRLIINCDISIHHISNFFHAYFHLKKVVHFFKKMHTKKEKRKKSAHNILIFGERITWHCCKKDEAPQKNMHHVVHFFEECAR